MSDLKRKYDGLKQAHKELSVEVVGLREKVVELEEQYDHLEDQYNQLHSGRARATKEADDG